MDGLRILIDTNVFIPLTVRVPDQLLDPWDLIGRIGNGRIGCFKVFWVSCRLNPLGGVVRSARSVG